MYTIFKSIIFYISQWTIPPLIIEKKSYNRFFKVKAEKSLFIFLFFKSSQFPIILIGIKIRIFVNWAIFIACVFKVKVEFMLCFFLSIHSDLFRFIYFVRILLFFRIKGRVFFGGSLLFLFSLLPFGSCFYIAFFLTFYIAFFLTFSPFFLF